MLTLEQLLAAVFFLDFASVARLRVRFSGVKTFLDKERLYNGAIFPIFFH
jgi:hypothetical protein